MSDADLLALFEELLKEGADHDASMQLLGLTQQQAAPHLGPARASASAASSSRGEGSMTNGLSLERRMSGGTASTSGPQERRTAQEPSKQPKGAWEVSAVPPKQPLHQHGALQFAPGRRYGGRLAVQGTCGELQGQLATAEQQLWNSQPWQMMSVISLPVPQCRLSLTLRSMTQPHCLHAGPGCAAV